MYCRKCGAANDDNAYRCVQCGEVMQTPPAVRPPAPKVDDYLVWSILVTVFCCLIPGIVAIVYSAQVGGKVAAGDYDGAVQSANTARTWCWVAFGAGLLVFLGYIAIFAIGIATGNMH